MRNADINIDIQKAYLKLNLGQAPAIAKRQEFYAEMII